MFQFFLCLIVVLSSFAAHAAKKNICTVTANSKDEREVFQSKLNPQDFNFIELTDYSSDKNDKRNDWFQNACEQKVQCDVLIVSGHFGGSFYGDSGFSLGLSELEKNSCQSRCHGILEKPKEVYLFGCNTLASKEQDHRTPQDYYRALVEHDVAPAEAERIVAARYSPLGSSNQERMQRIFEGVPMIYGFSSVGPAGKHIRPSLTKYLNEIGDYKKHLQSIEDGYRDNKTFMKNMTAYTTRVTTGMKSGGENSEVKANTCQLNDDSISKEDRVSHAGQILEKSPYIYFPVVSNFIRENFRMDSLWSDESTDKEAKELVRLTANLGLKEQVLKISRMGGFGPSLQMDMLSFSRTVRWISSEEFRVQSRAVVLDILSNPSRQNADLLCSLSDEYSNIIEGIEIRSEDLPSRFSYSSRYSLNMLGCLNVVDEKITAQALDALRKLNLKATMENYSIMYSVLELPGYENEMVQFLESLPPFTGSYAKEINRAIKFLILKKVKGPQQAEYVKKAFQSNPKDKESVRDVLYHISNNTNLTAESETIYLYQSMLYLAEYPNEYLDISFTARPVVQDWVAQHIPVEGRTSHFYKYLFYDMRMSSQLITSRLADTLLSYVEQYVPTDDDRTTPSSNISLINKIDLTEAQVRRLARIYLNSKENVKEYMRPMLVKKRAQFPFLRNIDLSGTQRFFSCVKIETWNSSTTTCSTPVQ